MRIPSYHCYKQLQGAIFRRLQCEKLVSFQVSPPVFGSSILQPACPRRSVWSSTVAASKESPPEAPASIHKQLEASLDKLETTTLVPVCKPLVIVVSGPSGVGKDSVVRKLQEVSTDLHFVVTATSRPIRNGEEDGVDYIFMTREEFEQGIEAGEFIEHALVYGDYKGIPRSQVDAAQREGKDVILRLDVQGAATMKSLYPDCISLFLAAESEASLVHRLIERKTEALDSLLIRIKTARSELRRLHEFDYVVVNEDDKLNDTVKSIQAIILAEKCRVHRALR